MSPAFVDIGKQRYVPDREPSSCPLCHYSINPNEREWSLCPSNGVPERVVEVVYRCPRLECGRVFIARYERTGRFRESILADRSVAGHGELRLLECLPGATLRPHVPKEIQEASPDFCAIYAQALTAEAFGLDQIAGGGLRKALEFLIKDFCLVLHPNSALDIRRSLLGQCIERFVSSADIKACARRAAWLGNDELHYERRWADQDVDTLKQLIQLTMTWIHNVLLTKHYEREMPD